MNHVYYSQKKDLVESQNFLDLSHNIINNYIFTPKSIKLKIATNSNSVDVIRIRRLAIG